MGGLELRRWTWSCLLSEGFAAIPLRTAERTRHATERNEREGAVGAERTADVSPLSTAGIQRNADEAEKANKVTSSSSSY